MVLKAAPMTSTTARQPVMDKGMLPARLVQVIDLGLQPQVYMGETKTPQREISVTYEFPTELCVDEDGQPMADKPRWLSEDFVLYPRTADRAKSAKRMTALDPDNTLDDDWSKVLGFPCLALVVHNASKTKKDDEGNPVVYANIGEVQPPMKDQQIGELVNTPVMFDLDEPDLAVFSGLPEFIQTKIKSNLEFQGSPLQALLGGQPSTAAAQPEAGQEPAVDDDDIPY